MPVKAKKIVHRTAAGAFKTPPSSKPPREDAIVPPGTAANAGRKRKA